jgi:hypothetical protein
LTIPTPPPVDDTDDDDADSRIIPLVAASNSFPTTGILELLECEEDVLLLVLLSIVVVLLLAVVVVGEVKDCVGSKMSGGIVGRPLGGGEANGESKGARR